MPFAVILGCSDSRVPAELVFDQGLGDLFVVRVAGNTVAPSQVGSMEFAVDRFGTELVVVLGHTGCGAIAATLDALADPSVLVRRSVRANVRAAANHLRHGSDILEERIAAGHLLVAGAEYSLETGEVDFFDVPEPGATRAAAEVG